MLDQELFDLLEGTADAAFVVTDQCEICSWNKAAEKLFGYNRVEAVGKGCQPLLHGRTVLGIEVWGGNCSIWDCAARRVDVPNFDLEVKIHSGRRIWISVSTLLYESSRNHRHLLVHFAHDITEEKKNEELLRKMTQISRQLASVPDVVGRMPPVSPLSEQERDILQLFSVGKNSTEIARKLGITLQTLRNHLHHINQKLHTHNRLEAVTHAMQRKLV
ncbi:MAG TPA: LuxR C-terminal-related transcriptional regulator [Candidatus Acidoferrales bacterium]|nr:LuxR C-terminal-related transcriptional regulator [Candidatus Acidoferrales bacterium]